ncbi:MAG: hypothetical protein LC799_19860, partial [Actinobacteria bacterium]|nr:hypothetical protein [Actinomycetota bacterium]
MHYLTNGVPTAVRLANSGTSAQNGLATTSFFVTDTWTIDRLTLNVGARFDRYRPYLPAQTTPVSRFNPVELTYAAIPEVIVFNHLVPRFGATYDLTGDGKTVLKGNWGRFYFNPGVNLADAVNSNTSDQYTDWNWNDRNGDRIYQEGEETTFIQRVGAGAGSSLSSNLENPHTDEASVFVERALMADLGVRVGYVWKHDSDGWQRDNANRPLDAFNVPVTIRDPGPDGTLGNGDDGADIAGFNLNPANLALASNNVVATIPGYDGTYKTLELSANKRYSNRWSLNAAFSYTWSEEYGNLY